MGQGFDGSSEEWLESLKGDSSYDVYLKTSSDEPKKSLSEWLSSLKGDGAFIVGKRRVLLIMMLLRMNGKIQ